MQNDIFDVLYHGDIDDIIEGEKEGVEIKLAREEVEGR